MRARPNTDLIELRINRGLSPNDLGRLAGVSGNEVRLVERGFIPGPRVQFAIARVFGMDPTALWPMESQKELA